MLSGLSSVVFAQDLAARVPQVVPFASSGGLVTEATATKLSETGGGSVAVKAGSLDTLVQPGGKIGTAEGGGTSLVIGSLGSARLGSDSEVKVPDGYETGHSLELLKGQLFMNISGEEIKKRQEGEFKLKTPAALLAVKGTRFFTLSASDGDTIGVHHGTITVTEPQSGNEITLEAGHAVTASPGLLGDTRPLTDEEAKLAPQYDLASLKAMPVPAILYSRRNDFAVSFRDGKVVKAVGDAFKFVSPQPCIFFQDYYGDKQLMTQDGCVQFTWLTKMKDTWSRRMVFNFAGKGFEKTPELSGAPPVLKLAAVRFRYRTSNMVPLKLTCLNSHSYLVPHGSGYSPTKNPLVETVIRLANDNDWHELVLPLRSGVFYGWNKKEPAAGVEYSAEDISLALDPSQKQANENRRKREAYVLQMKDFEVLVIP